MGYYEPAKKVKKYIKIFRESQRLPVFFNSVARTSYNLLPKFPKRNLGNVKHSSPHLSEFFPPIIRIISDS